MLEKNDNTIETTPVVSPDEKVSEKVLDTVAEKAAEIDLEESTEKRLEQVFDGGGLKDDPAEKPEESEKTTPGSEDQKPEVKADEKDDSTLDEKPESHADEKDTEVESKAKDEEADKSDKEVPQLSDAYYRAAIHRGMQPDEIKDFYNNNPELCIKTLGNIYEAVKRSNEEFATLGRAEKARVAKETAAKATPSKTEYKGVDIEALEKTDIDPDTLAVIKTMNEQNKTLYTEVQGMREAKSVPGYDQSSGEILQESRASAQETAAIQQQIENFWKSDDVKLYAEFYGVTPKDAVDWDALSPGQKANRWAVVLMMDDLIVGARINNRDITIDEAMQSAHINISESVSKKIIREEIKADVLKRSNSLTLKPSSAVKSESTSPQTEKELIGTTQARLDKVFGA